MTNMTKASKQFFSHLQTTSSEVSNKNYFNTRYTIYVPDFFIIFFSISLFCSSIILDCLILYYLIIDTNLTSVLVFSSSIISYVISNAIAEKCGSSRRVYLETTNEVSRLVMHALQMVPPINCVRILRETFGVQSMLVKPTNVFPLPFFHLSNENLNDLKIFYCIYLAFRSIPQLFISCILILENPFAKTLGLLLTTNIMINTAMFSQMMATTFPIRKTPRVFTSCTCIVLNAVNKFMATTCACCIHLTIFALAFAKIRYYAILVQFVKSLIWAWPCWCVLNHQPVPLSKCNLTVSMIIITLIFSFIYIHPFEGEGKLYYYFFYLLSFLYELFIIYIYLDSTLKGITYYYTLKFLMIGFLSCFGLLNILHKYRGQKHEVFVVKMEGNETPEKDREVQEEENINTNSHAVKVSKISEKNTKKEPSGS